MIIDKTSSWHLNGFPDIVTLGQQYNIGENPPLYSTLTLIAMQGHQTCILCLCDTFAWQLMILYSILVDFFPPPYIFLFAQAPILVYGSMVLLSTLVLSS